MNRIASALLVVLIVWSSNAMAAGPTATERFDAGLTIRLDDLPFVEAIKHMALVAEVEIRVTPEAIDALPYSDRTKVTIVLDDATVRMGLSAICTQLGLVFDATHDRIVVKPSPELRRIARAATWDEIDTISQLRSASWSDADALKNHLTNRLRFSGVGGAHEDNWKKLKSAINPNRDSTIEAALSEGCDAMGWTWYPEGKQVVVLPKQAQIARQLERIISVHHYGGPLAQVLRDLSRHADLPITFEGSAAATLPPETKEDFTLIAEGVSVKEAIIQIALTADCDHVIRSDKVVLVRSDRMGPPARRRHGRDTIVGAIRVPSQSGGFTYDWFIRESDLTPEENTKRELQVKEAIEAMKKDLANIEPPQGD
ncbi:MAG: hypothetical protein DHS20C16_24410 [Phycisphaerae bacterium]|nr:MAG: hypothetical protein DHS20C16_24410 [Phycisphaerae bacterium]